MTEIKVITEDATGNLLGLNDEELEMAFEYLASENKDIPKFIFDDFADLHRENVKIQLQNERPEINELLVRKIISMGKKYDNGIAVPIISSLKHKTTHPSGMKVRFDGSVLASSDEGLSYAVAPGEEVTVLGFIVNPIHAKAHLLGKNSTLRPMKQRVHDIGDRLVAGNYTVESICRPTSEYFLPTPNLVRIDGHEYESSHVLRFSEIVPETLNRILARLHDYILQFENHLFDESLMRFVRTQISHASTPALKQFQKYLVNTSVVMKAAENTVENPALNLLETVHLGRFTRTSNLAVCADMDMRGMNNIYKIARLKGVNDPSVGAEIRAYTALQARRRFADAVKLKAVEERNQITAYKILIGKKLGNKRLLEIEKAIEQKPQITAQSKNILGLLEAQERKIIELEITKRDQYIDAVLNNKCPHVMLYRRFRLAKTDQKSKELFKSLSKFFKQGDKGMITCNNCGFDVMCPHVRIRTELYIAGKSQSETKSQLEKYISDSSRSDAYYCKICGEILSKMVKFGDLNVPPQMDEELRNFIWVEMASASRFLKFEHLVNMQSFITSMRDACYTPLSDIEKQLLKSKTNSTEEIKAKKRLYTTIYAFAYMVRIIYENSARDITFRDFTKGKNLVVDLMKYSLDAIMTSRNVVIRDVPGVTSETVKNLLVRAFKTLQTSSQHSLRQIESTSILPTLIADPVFTYLNNVNNLDSILRGQRRHKQDFADKIDTMMGAPLAVLCKQRSVFEKAMRPKFDTVWNLKKFDSLATDSLQPGAYKAAKAGYVARSFELFNEKLTERLYESPVYSSVVSDNGVDTETSAILREPFQKHRDNYLALLKQETAYLKSINSATAQNWTLANNTKSRRWVNTGVDINRIYDEEGIPHVWSIFVVTNDTDRGEFTNKDFVKSVESGKVIGGTITDKKCSVCGILKSQTHTLDVQKIMDSLNARNAINNFFRFYENRCPLGSLHSFADNVCEKCNINNKYIITPNSPDSMKYYRTYRLNYAEDRRQLAFKMVEHKQQLAEVAQDYSSEYENWSQNYNHVLELSSFVKISDKLVMSIGAMEKQNYVDVENGTYIPRDVEERNDPRIFTLDTHIKNLITEYNQVKYFYNATRPPAALSALLDSSGISKHKIMELPKMLPDIFNDYTNRFRYVHRHKKPRETVLFCIQTLCEMCLKIVADTTNETQKLRHDFVVYYVKKIVKSEEMLTKAGHFNISLLYGNKSFDKNEYDTNTAGDNDGRDQEKGDMGDDYGDSASPFADAFDTEDADGDDNDNEWTVGRDDGLD